MYGFIKQSNGHIKIYSELGQGTAVELLPRLLGEGPIEAELPDAQEAPNGGTGELILVVEDDPAVRSYSTELLRELGYRVNRHPMAGRDCSFWRAILPSASCSRMSACLVA